MLERALLLSHGKQLTTEHFYGLEPVTTEISTRSSSKYADIEESHIRAILKRFHGDTAKASKALGMSRATLYRKLKKFRITPEVNYDSPSMED